MSLDARQHGLHFLGAVQINMRDKPTSDLPVGIGRQYGAQATPPLRLCITHEAYSKPGTDRFSNNANIAGLERHHVRANVVLEPAAKKRQAITGKFRQNKFMPGKSIARVRCAVPSDIAVMRIEVETDIAKTSDNVVRMIRLCPGA